MPSIGVPHCPNCGHEISRQTTEQIVEQVLALKSKERVMILAPIVRGRKGEYKKELEKLARQGFVRARIDGVLRGLDEEITLDRRKNHTIEVVVDRLVIKPEIEKRLEASILTATKLADGLVQVVVVNGSSSAAAAGSSNPTRKSGDSTDDRLYSQKLACPDCGASVPQLEPRSFSFNSPFGACETCHGLGSKWTFDPAKMIVDPSRPLLEGGLGPGGTSSFMLHALSPVAARLKIPLHLPFADLPAKSQTALTDAAIEIMDRYLAIDENHRRLSRLVHALYVAVPVPGLQWAAAETVQPLGPCERVDHCGVDRNVADARTRNRKKWKLTEREHIIGGRAVEEIRNRLEFLVAVGLDYLSLERSAATLSGGEAQRIRLATQIGSRLRGVLYVLDEPSIGLHPRDNHRFLDSLARLRDLGNTVLVVEHDAETIERADYVIDLGPGAGRLGGALVAQGTPLQIEENAASLTGQYLSGVRKIDTSRARRTPTDRRIVIHGASEHNLKNIDVEFPLGFFIVITGVSGSGKSTLVNDILYRAAAKEVYGSLAAPGANKKIEGLENIDKVVEIDQSPIGRTPRSNPATYTQVFTLIRDWFAKLPESRERGYKPGRFSFNVKGGRCEACQGDGLKRIEMNFLPDVYVTCDVCRGRRYNHETLQVKYKGHSIAELLESPIEDALPLLENIPQIKAKLETLVDVGLGYLHLGQSSTTLSGGEAQRIKLARELSKRQTGRTLYILDEPTTGLHFEDVRKLLDVLHSLVDLGNTVVVIEHQLDVVKTADWIIDLGPEGGDRGGYVVAVGSPEEILHHPKSYTGQALRALAKNGAGRA